MCWFSEDSPRPVFLCTLSHSYQKHHLFGGTCVFWDLPSISDVILILSIHHYFRPDFDPRLILKVFNTDEIVYIILYQWFKSATNYTTWRPPTQIYHNASSASVHPQSTHQAEWDANPFGPTKTRHAPKKAVFAVCSLGLTLGISSICRSRL